MANEVLTEEIQTTAEIDRDLKEKWLTFWLDGQLYCMSVIHVEGIMSMMPITVVPEYPSYAKGIIDLRGTIIPVLDLRLRFGKKEAAYTEKTCIVNCRIGEQNVGFVVDEMDAVITIRDDMISNPPRMVEDPAKRYLTGIARVASGAEGKEKIILCLDVTKLLQQEELNNLVRA